MASLKAKFLMTTHPTKYYSNIQENRIASALGWDVVTGSGSRTCVPGDVVSRAWLGECKTHTCPGHPIEFKIAVWKKLEDEAVAKYKNPVLFVDDGSQQLSATWCLVSNLSQSIYSDFNSIEHPLKVLKSGLKFDGNLLAKTLHSDLVSKYIQVRAFDRLFQIFHFPDFLELFGD